MEVDLLPVGTLVDERYEILQCLGTGGMGTVYKARELALDRFVALKVLHPFLMQDPDNLRRFELEGKVLCQITHTNLVGCYRFGVWLQRFPYLSMEYLEGLTLRSILNTESEPGKPIKRERALKLAIQVCAGLEAAHNQKILHRDIKPENIFVCNSAGVETAKLLDFGLAKVLVGSGQGSTQSHTKTGTLVGSVQYMSPEQCRGQSIDERSDLYSLTCVIFEMLTGCMPFNADSAVAFLHLHVNSARPRISDHISKAGDIAELQHLIETGMAVAPERRYQSVLALKQDLEAVLTENLESIRKRVDKEKSSMQRHRAVVFFTTSLLVFLAAAVCYQLFREDIGLRLFLQRKHDCAQIEEKMLGFLKAGRVDLAESLMTELQNCDKGKIRSPYEIEKLVLLIRSLREKDRDAAARQLTNLRDSWLDASLDKALADRQNQEKMMLNKLIELKLASLGPARKNSSYRKQLYQLISKMYLLRQEILDPSVGEKMIKSYLYSVGPADEIPGQELMEVYCFDVRISAAKGKDALAEIKKIRAELERRWGKGNVWYVKFISNACGLLKPDEFERVLLEALALERQGVGTTEMESTLNSLARNYASLRKHELSLRYYKEALSLSLENIENGKMQSDFYLDSSNSIPAGKLISVLHGLCSCCIECLALNDRRVAEDYFNRAVATFDQITISQTEERVEGVGAAKALMGAAISMAQFERGAAAVSRLIKRGRKMDNDDMRVKSTFLGIVNVSENLSRMEKAYRSCLGRVPDRSADWDRLYEIVLDKPFPLEELCVDLARSPEFLQKLEKLDAPSQVEYLYLHLLGRPADAQGRKFWMETLHKIGLQQTIIEFTKSSDFSREFERRLKREGLEG